MTDVVTEADFLARLHRAATAQLDALDRQCLRTDDPPTLVALFATRLTILRERHRVEVEQSKRSA